MLKKRFRRSVWLPVALAVYLTVFYIYLFIQGNLRLEAGHLGVVALSYALVILLAWVNRRWERREENKSNDHNT